MTEPGISKNLLCADTRLLIYSISANESEMLIPDSIIESDIT